MTVYDVLYDNRYDKDLCPTCGNIMTIERAVRSPKYETFLYRCCNCGCTAWLLLEKVTELTQ